MIRKITYLLIFIPILCYSQDTTQSALYTKFFKETNDIKNWSDFQSYFHNNEIIDDGIFGEIYCDITEKLFMNQFKQYFQPKITQDNMFNSFILKHISQLWLDENLNKLKFSVENKCPRNNKKLCRIISTRIDSIISIQKSN